MKSLLLFLYCILAVFSNVLAFPVNLGGSDIQFFRDDNIEYQIKEIDEKHFQNLNSSSVNFGFYNGQVWLKINLNKFQGAHFIELKNSNLDEIEFYERIDSNWNSISIQGDLLPFSDRLINHRNFRFPLNETRELLIRIRNYGDQFFVPIELHSETSAYENDYLEQLIYGLYFGLGLFVFLLNLFLFIKIREKQNILYLLYVFGLLILQLSLCGLGAQFVWGENTFITNHMAPFSATLSVFFLIAFTREFLDTRRNQPKADRVLYYTSILLVINLVLSIIPQDNIYRISIIGVNVITLILNLVIIPIAAKSLLNNTIAARFFLIAFIGLIISVFLFILRNFGILPSNLLTDYSLLIGSSFEMVLLTFAIVDRFQTYKETAVERMQELNKVKEEQNIQLESIVKERTVELAVQKKELEEKNKEVYDSINYAKHLQKALIPDEKRFNGFFEDSFVLFKPRDIVSGDFYWVTNVVTTRNQPVEDQLIVFSVADCTGHGVPGAFISVLGLKILNSSIKNKDVNTPQEALDYLNGEFNLTFDINKNENTVNDGMDIVICAIDPIKKMLYFSGAMNSIFIARKGELIELKGDRRPIGKTYSEVQFTGHSMQLQSEDALYAFTDGFADQFGGKQNKKFKLGKLKKLLLDNANLSMSEQQSLLNSTITEWKGKNDQTDDICIIGIRIR